MKDHKVTYGVSGVGGFSAFGLLGVLGSVTSFILFAIAVCISASLYKEIEIVY